MTMEIIIKKKHKNELLRYYRPNEQDVNFEKWNIGDTVILEFDVQEESKEDLLERYYTHCETILFDSFIHPGVIDCGSDIDIPLKVIEKVHRTKVRPSNEFPWNKFFDLGSIIVLEPLDVFAEELIEKSK